MLVTFLSTEVVWVSMTKSTGCGTVNTPMSIRPGDWICNLTVTRGDLNLTGVDLASVQIESIQVAGNVYLGALDGVRIGTVSAGGEISFQGISNSEIGSISGSGVSFASNISSSLIQSVQSSRQVSFFGDVIQVHIGDIYAYEEVQFFRYITKSSLGNISGQLYGIYFFRAIQSSSLENLTGYYIALLGQLQWCQVGDIHALWRVRLWRSVVHTNIGQIYAPESVGIYAFLKSLAGDISSATVWFDGPTSSSRIGTIQATEFGWTGKETFPCVSLSAGSCKKVSRGSLLGTTLPCPAAAA
uniref:Uncharacterized protein n=1 Tax=Compsopogon caeruleus TaxID=31354 RepID=A0A7S1XGP8_9RHOD